MARNIVVLCIICISICTSLKLPSYFTKCKKSDPNLNNCIIENIKKGYDEFKKGDTTYHIQPLNPLKVPVIFIDINGGLIINLTDVTLSGFDDSRIKDVDFDVENKQITLRFNIPSSLNCQSQYDVNGKILILPIQGHGPMNVTYVEPKITHVLNYDLEKKGNKEYIVFKKNKYSYEVSRVHFALYNLFNGDKRLGEEMLKFLNENWKEVDGEVGEKLSDAFGTLLMKIYNDFFRRIPYDDLLDN